MSDGAQRTLRIVDQEKGGKIINFDIPNDSQTVRQFIAAYHWQHGEKNKGLNTGFLGLYRERKEEGREGEWEMLPDSANLASCDLADDELLMLKLRPQTIYVTMTKPFVIDFSEPLEAVLPSILAGFGETLTADFLSRYCLQKEAVVTDKVSKDRGACTISDCNCEDYLASSMGRNSGMSGMCRRCGHKSSTHHYRPGPTSYELLDLNKTLSDNNVVRNAALLLKKTAYRITSSDDIVTVSGGAGSQRPLSRSGNLQRKISISPEFDEDSTSEEDNGEENPLRGGPTSSHSVLSPREVAAAESAKGLSTNSSDGLTIRKWRQRMRSLNRLNSMEDTGPNPDTSRDRVYGVPLEDILAHERREGQAKSGSGEATSVVSTEEAEPTIPKMITSMLQFLETEEALNAEGIFRLSSNYEEMMRIKDQLDRRQEVNFGQCGAHMVINLLKKFLHELPDPLLSGVLYQRYISAVQGEAAVRLAYLVALLNSLPPSSRSLLQRLLVYLRKVVAHSGENRMDLHNLATTLAPVLMREKPTFQQAAFASGSVVLPPRQQRSHQRRASDSAVVHAMAQEAVRAAKILEILLSTPDEELFPSSSAGAEGSHHLSVGRAKSDIKALPLSSSSSSSSSAEAAEHLVLQTGDIVFVFQKRDDVWWIEHKTTRKLLQVQAAEAELALTTVTDKVELMQHGKESGDTRAIERVLSCDDLEDYDDDGEEESPRLDTRSRGFKSSFIGINLNSKKNNNKTADTTLVVERNRLYGNADAKLISPFAKPASLGTSNSYTNDSPTSPTSPGKTSSSSSSSSSTVPREKRKSIGIGNALLGPRKDRERSGSSPRDKDASSGKEHKKEKKEHKKEKKEHKREKKSKEKEGQQEHTVVNPLLSHSGTFATSIPPS